MLVAAKAAAVVVAAVVLAALQRRRFILICQNYCQKNQNPQTLLDYSGMLLGFGLQS
jgi:hypothetical protein